MTVHVDAQGLLARRREARTKEHPECDAWFELGGSSGQDAFELVARACAATSPHAHAVGTTTGTFVQLFMPDWESAGQQIAQRLSDAGHDVAVTVPPIPPCPAQFDEVMLPFLVLAHRLDPAAETVPLRERGDGHSNLPAGPREHRMARAAEWLIEPGAFGGVGDAWRLMPATREDFAPKAESFLGTIFDIYADGYDNAGTFNREVIFADWGVTTWRANLPGLTQLERVNRLRDLLIEFADDIELGAISLDRTIGPGGFRTPPLEGPWQVPWSCVPQLWSTYVSHAHAIQVVNDEHLAKAHDLSDWHVETISSGRHLIQARDLEPWFDIATHEDPVNWTTREVRQVPDQHVLDKARSDFGDMIITRQDIREWRQRAHKAEDLD